MFEKKRGKRFLASVMALVMLLSLAPVGALAAGETPTNEECSTMPLPANEDNPKPVVTDEENTANTNEEPTPPPPNEGDAATSANKNNISTTISETPVISDPVQDLTGDVLYDLYDFNGRQPGANIGYVRKNYTVTYNANLPNGASLISGVTLPDAQTFSTSGMVVRIKDLSGRNSYNRDAQVSGENKYYKFLGWAETSDATTAKYTPGQYFSVFRNTTLYAVWERNDKDVMYFVLMPGIDAPSNGADQGYQKYYPNKTDENDRNGDDGGVSGCTVYTGYTGGNLTATGFDAVPTEGNSVVDLAGQYSNSTYLSVPSNLGYFNANTKTEKLNLDMTGKEIVWYVIKNQEDGYHVDGYVKNVPIKVRYHENFNGDTDVKDTVTDIVSGETVTVKTAKAVFGEGYTHQGYTFAGWSTSQGEDGTVYQPGNQTEQLVTSLDLYAKWVKNDSATKKLSYTVEYRVGSETGTLLDSEKVDVNIWMNDTTYTVNEVPAKTFNGYTLAASGSTELPATVRDGDTIYVIYEKDGTATKKLSYTVEYRVGSKAGTLLDSEKTDVNIWMNDATYTVNEVPAKTFNGYTLAASGSTELPATVRDGEIIYVIYEKSEPEKVTYTINQHFMNGKGEKDSALDKPGTTQSADKDTALSDLIKDLAKDQPIGKDKYMYVSGKYTTKSESQKDQPIESGSKLTEDTTIDLYYYLDNWKDADTTEDTSNKDSETGGDGIPDCDQVLIKYASSNSERGTVSPDMEVLTLRKDNENVQIKINGSKATDNGGRNYFSNWTDTTGKQVSTNATLNNETIQKVIKEFTGGETYTFTANFGYSGGGGGGGSRPTVTIPDDVPTGLNGKDHYAYIIGYGNNDVRPQNNITRAEVATIFFRLLTDETREANMTKSNSYNDVKDGDWFCCAVSTLSKMGIIKGYEDGSFKPNDPISRAEFAAIAARFDPDGDKTPATFADVTSHWAKDEISIAANHGWIKGYEDGSFKPDQKITRAETMTLVNRVLNRLPETKDDLHKDMKTWVDNMDETAWYYLAVQEATNSHYFKNKTSTKFEQWTDLRDTRDWSELEK